MAIQANAKYFDARWWKVALSSRLNDAVTSIRFAPYETRLTVNGIGFNFAVTTPLAKNWYARHANIHSHEMDAIVLLGLNDATVFECGGHHGRDCILLSKMVGDEGKVVSFEPFPENFEALQKNLEINQISNTVAVNAAVGAKPGALHIKSRSNAKVTSRGGIAVPVITLDEWAETNAVWPDVIKIDVEGFEFEVLRGAEKILRRTPALSVEIHCDIVGEFGAVPEDIWRLIDITKYDIWIQRNDGVAAIPLVRTTKLEGRPHLLFLPKDRHATRLER
jgi:FkbM family methyltransferase